MAPEVALGPHACCRLGSKVHAAHPSLSEPSRRQAALERVWVGAADPAWQEVVIYSSAQPILGRGV